MIGHIYCLTGISPCAQNRSLSDNCQIWEVKKRRRPKKNKKSYKFHSLSLSLNRTVKNFPFEIETGRSLSKAIIFYSYSNSEDEARWLWIWAWGWAWLTLPTRFWFFSTVLLLLPQPLISSKAQPIHAVRWSSLSISLPLKLPPPPPPIASSPITIAASSATRRLLRTLACDSTTISLPTGSILNFTYYYYYYYYYYCYFHFSYYDFDFFFFLFGFVIVTILRGYGLERHHRNSRWLWILEALWPMFRARTVDTVGNIRFGFRFVCFYYYYYYYFNCRNINFLLWRACNLCFVYSFFFIEIYEQCIDELYGGED